MVQSDSKKATKTVVQCDFDGTVTIKDVSFMLLDAFTDGDWRQRERAYAAGEISIGRFNAYAFSMITVDRQTMLDFIKGRVEIRPGFTDFVATCRQYDIRLVIVSNGLSFYIDQILQDIGLPDIEFHAAETRFSQEGLCVEYQGVDGTVYDTGLKDVYVKSLLSEGYRVNYIGDGRSDFAPASQCHKIFATADGGRLLPLCRREGVDCQPFIDFREIISVLEST